MTLPHKIVIWVADWGGNEDWGEKKLFFPKKKGDKLIWIICRNLSKTFYCKKKSFLIDALTSSMCFWAEKLVLKKISFYLKCKLFSFTKSIHFFWHCKPMVCFWVKHIGLNDFLFFLFCCYLQFCRSVFFVLLKL